MEPSQEQWEQLLTTISLGFDRLGEAITYGMPQGDDVERAVEIQLARMTDRVDSTVNHQLSALVGTVERELRRMR